MAQVMGAENITLPNPEEEMMNFRKWLETPPEQGREESKERVTLLKALGLRR